MKTLNINFGALADPISKQIKKQGFSFDARQLVVFQEQSEAILKLRFAGILTDSMMDKAQSKLFGYIKNHIQSKIKTRTNEDKKLKDRKN